MTPDTVVGGDGADLLLRRQLACQRRRCQRHDPLGDAGNDTIYGGVGNDTIDGGAE